MADSEHGFQAKVEADRPRKIGSDFPCAVVFYAAVLVTLVLSAVIFSLKNTEVMRFDRTGVTNSSCPSGYSACQIPSTGQYAHFGLCMTDELCDDVKTCVSSRRLSDEQLRRLAGTEIAQDVWEFLEQHAYQPAVLFAALLILAVLWLFAMQRIPKAVVWGTLVADILLMVLVFVLFYIESKVINIACIVLAGCLSLFCFLARKNINRACVILKSGMDGLLANKRLFLVTFGVQIVWVAFFALWIAAMVSRHFVREVNHSVNDAGVRCGLQESWPGSPILGLYFVLQYYWFTAFMHNINLMVITSSLSGWYFSQDDFNSNVAHALKWSVFQQAGGNAIASAVIGVLGYLFSRVASMRSLIFGLLNPLEWIPICLGLALKSVAMTYTKFGVIAMTFSGETFCGAAPRGIAIMKESLGPALVADYVGKRIMVWCTYVISMSIGFAMWGWADATQDVTTFDALGDSVLFLMVVIAGYAWVMSYPALGLLVLVIAEPMLVNINLGDESRKALNSIFASLFVGCVSCFLLRFISGVVVDAMDVMLFCLSVERKSGKMQPQRFAAFYDNTKETFVLGSVAGGIGAPAPCGTIVGQPGDPAPTAEQPQAEREGKV